MYEFQPFSGDRDGFNSRLMDCGDAAIAVAKEASKRGCKSLIFAGDWFHSRRKVSVDVLHVSDRVLKAIHKLGLEVHGLLGNHDWSLDGKATSVLGQKFDAVYSVPCVEEIDGWRVCFIPWTDDPEVVRHWLAEEADLYVGHFGVAGSKVGPSDFEIPGRISLKDISHRGTEGAPLVLGHYHKPQNIIDTETMYVGSPLQLGWGEAGEEKRFLIFRRKSGGVTHESVPLDKFPRFVRCGLDKLDSCRAQDFIEVVVKDPKQVQWARNKVKLGRDTARVVLEVATPEEAVRLDLSGMNIRAQLAEYVKHVGPPPGLDEKFLVSLGLSLVEGRA